MLGEPGKGDPLAHPRITLFCSAVMLEAGSSANRHARRRYLNRHPKAKLYADFGDFAYFRLDPSRANLNGGFAKAYHLEREDLLAESRATKELTETEQDAIDHMNADHADAVASLAHGLAGARDGGWVMTGIDAEGVDIARGDMVQRICFSQPLGGAGELREAIVALARTARGEP